VTGTGPRIAPLPVEEWDDEAVTALRTAFGEQAATGLLAQGAEARPVPNVLTTMMRHPALSGPFLVYNQVLLRKPTLDPRARELMILRVAWRARAPYEWIQHVRIARSLGFTDAELEAIAFGADAEVWSELEADLLAATDELLDAYRIADDTWARLAAQLDEPQLIELAFVVGTYTCLAMAFNTFGLELDLDLHTVDAPPLPDASG
jgi:alkylhydroperoxidase family enzyme